MPSLKKRRAVLYSVLTEEAKKLPITAIIDKSYKISALECFSSLCRFDLNKSGNYVQKEIRAVKRAVLADARRLIILPEMSNRICFNADFPKVICQYLPKGKFVVTAYERKKEGDKKALIIESSGLKGEIFSSHIGKIVHEIKVRELFPDCSIAVLFEDEMIIPEIARIAMLKGADILIWFDRGNDPFSLKIMQTRPVENKIFVIREVFVGENGYSLVVNPDGRKLFTTFKAGEQISSGILDIALSKEKQVVPRTNIIYGRNPNFYKELIR